MSELKDNASIYRFELGQAHLGDFGELELPLGTQVLHFDHQVRNGDIVFSLWGFVNPHITETEKRTFMIVGTGQDFQMLPGEAVKHIGTVKMNDSFTMFHLFEKRNIASLQPGETAQLQSV